MVLLERRDAREGREAMGLVVLGVVERTPVDDGDADQEDVLHARFSPLAFGIAIGVKM